MERLAAELNERLGRGAATVGSTRSGEPERTPRSVVRATLLTEEAVLEAMNEQRARYSLPPLRMNPKLRLAANDRVGDMFTQRYFDHVAPDGTSPFVWAKSRGYRYRTIGENLAEGQRSAREVVADWMSSPGHRANILGRAFDECGIAIAEGSPVRRSRGYTFVALYAAR